MSNDIPVKGDRPKPSPEPRLDPPKRTDPLRLPDKVADKAIDRESNRYTPKEVNSVLKDLKAQVSQRPEKLHEMAALQEHAHRRPEKEGVARPSKGTASPEEIQRAKALLAAALGKGKGRESGEGQEGLGAFEKIFVEHFAKGTPVGEKLEKGQHKFLPKSEQSWKDFFKQFLPFTLKKTVNISQLESLIYRGLMKEGGKATLISDLKFLNGMLDKFARLNLSGVQVLEKLAEMVPGDVLAAAVVAELLESPEFAYLGLSHKVVNPDGMKDATSLIANAYQSPEKMRESQLSEGMRDATKGIALDARTEQLISEKLEINLQRHKGGEAAAGSLLGKKKKKGMGEGEGSPEIIPGFVPWYQAGLKTKIFKGKVRWWMPLLYFVGFSTAGLVGVYVFKFLMQR